MKIKLKNWLLLILLSSISLIVWYKLSYPKMAFLNLSVNKNQAIDISKKFLKRSGYDIAGYTYAVDFSSDISADRYLQKTVGFLKLKEFVAENDYDMFLWIVRFFKEKQIEQFRVIVSSETGDVISFKHFIADTDKREDFGKEASRNIIEGFLKDSFAFDQTKYDLKIDAVNSLDKRTEYSFYWEKKSVDIPWSDQEESGNAKLKMGGVVSGSEILMFAKNIFYVPQKFNKFIEGQEVIGKNIASFMRIFYLFLFVSAFYYMYVRRNHLSMHLTKKFYIYIAIFCFFITLLSNFNHFDSILFGYSATSESLNSYLFRHFIYKIIGAVFFAVGILLPALSGELLHFEVLKDQKNGSFLTYLNSTFFSRSVSVSIFRGYFICLLLLGIQAVIFAFGEKYLGVWNEKKWIGEMTVAYLPFLSAFSLGFIAAITEEIMFRMFGLSFGKKLFKNVLFAVVFTSLIWGFGHTHYPIYPMWFRGVEVTIIGLFFCFCYLRYGLITVLIGHYLFDSFLASSGYILGKAQPFYFYSAISVLVLPLVFAIAAFFMNRSEDEVPLRWKLDVHQKYNLEILKNFLKSQYDVLKNEPKEKVINDIFLHGWDIAVVEFAYEDVFISKET